MARSRRPGALAIAAAVLDVLAIAALVADVLASGERDILSMLLLSFVGIPLALAGAVTSGVLLVRSVRRVPRRVLIVGVVVVTLLTVPIGGVALGIAYGSTPNPAASDEARVGAVVEAAGGHRLCGAGDPGLGPDNTQPYFFALYEVPTGVDVRPRVAARAQRLGWTVSSAAEADTENDLAMTVPRLQIDQGDSLGGGACGVYGKVERASAGMRLVQLEVVLPYR